MKRLCIPVSVRWWLKHADHWLEHLVQVRRVLRGSERRRMELEALKGVEAACGRAQVLARMELARLTGQRVKG